MANTTAMKEILGNLRFSRKVKEAAVLGDDYPDVKSFIQFYDGLERYSKEQLTEYDKAVADYKAKARDVRLLDDGSLEAQVKGHFGWRTGSLVVLRISSLEQATEDFESFLRAIKGATMAAKLRKALDEVKDLAAYEDNAGSKKGVDQVRKIIQDSDMLEALALSVKEDEEPKRESAKA